MRYKKYEKTILTDCDGVLLDWEWAFNCWMIQHGFETTEGYQFKYDMAERYGISKPQVQKLVKTFNESAAIGFLPVLTRCYVLGQEATRTTWLHICLHNQFKFGSKCR